MAIEDVSRGQRCGSALSGTARTVSGGHPYLLMGAPPSAQRRRRCPPVHNQAGRGQAESSKEIGEWHSSVFRLSFTREPCWPLSLSCLNPSPFGYSIRLHACGSWSITSPRPSFAGRFCLAAGDYVHWVRTSGTCLITYTFLVILGQVPGYTKKVPQYNQASQRTEEVAGVTPNTSYDTRDT